MTEQPPSAEALRIVEPYPLSHENWMELARRIDALIAQRVSAETERCAKMAQEAADYVRVGRDLVVIPARKFASDLALDIRDAIRGQG